VPWYGLLFVWHVIRGAARLSHRLIVWHHWPHGWQLESMAVAAGRAGHHEALRAHSEGKKTRGVRGRIIAAVPVMTAAAVVVVAAAPWQVWPGVGLVVVAVFAYHGRSPGKPLVQAAVVAPAYQPPTPEIITRALGSLGIAGINEVLRNGDRIRFVSDVHRDGE